MIVFALDACWATSQPTKQEPVGWVVAQQAFLQLSLGVQSAKSFRCVDVQRGFHLLQHRRRHPGKTAQSPDLAWVDPLQRGESLDSAGGPVLVEQRRYSGPDPRCGDEGRPGDVQTWIEVVERPDCPSIGLGPEGASSLRGLHEISETPQQASELPSGDDLGRGAAHTPACLPLATWVKTVQV